MHFHRIYLPFIVIFLTACDPEVLDLQINPDQVDPGGTVTVEYLISGDVSKISSIVLTGLPGTSSPVVLNIPTQSDVYTSNTITIGIPAKDKEYFPLIKVSHKNGYSTHSGYLVINERPTTLSQVSITPSTHSTSNNCQGSTNGIFERNLRYRIKDENGANDVDQAFISDAIPLSNSVTITDPPQVPLALPTTASPIEQSVDSTVNIKCDVNNGTYTFTVKIQDNDGATPQPLLSDDVSYAVTN